MFKDKLKKNTDLSRLTTFRIGGLAEFYVEVETREELREAIEWCRANHKKIHVLGGGSNILANDKGVAGLVIKLKNSSVEIAGSRLSCGAGTSLSKAVSLAGNAGLGGLEWAIGIPGTIGGAIRGNAGAFGHSIGESVAAIEVYNSIRGGFDAVDPNDCGFSYRNSIFKGDKNAIIWSVALKLEESGQDIIRQSMGGYLEKRSAAQPKLPSAGSVFMNLSIDSLRESNKSLAEMAEKLGMVKNGYVGAGWLIELLGLKGKTIGGAKISLEHANFIVNTGNAKTEDIIMLVSLVKQQARDKFGIQLQEEIQYFGI